MKNDKSCFDGIIILLTSLYVCIICFSIFRLYTIFALYIFPLFFVAIVHHIFCQVITKLCFMPANFKLGNLFLGSLHYNGYCIICYISLLHE